MKKYIYAALALAPTFAFAQQLSGIFNLVSSIRSLVNIAIPIVGGLILLAFFWGLMRFVFNAGDESAKESGRRLMINGIIALFVMASIWGIVNFIAAQFNLNNQNTQQVPTVNGL